MDAVEPFGALVDAFRRVGDWVVALVVGDRDPFWMISPAIRLPFAGRLCSRYRRRRNGNECGMPSGKASGRVVGGGQETHQIGAK